MPVGPARSAVFCAARFTALPGSPGYRDRMLRRRPGTSVR